jgi:hypothetical protein
MSKVMLTCQGSRDVPKIKKVPQNSRRYKDYAKQMPHWGPTNIRRYCTKFCRHGDVAARICAPLDYSTRSFMSFLSLYRKARDRNLKQATTSFFQNLFNLSSLGNHYTIHVMSYWHTKCPSNKQTEAFWEQSELVSFTLLVRGMSAQDPTLRRWMKINFHCI